MLMMAMIPKLERSMLDKDNGDDPKLGGINAQRQ
jgi:hypothetical protein